MPIKRLKITLFESFKYSPKCLRVLDLKKLETIGEQAMTRILMASSRTLQTFKMSYRNGNTFSRQTMVQLARCDNLKTVEFASLYDFIAQVPPNNLAHLKIFLARKTAKLVSLKLYDCDK